MKRKKQNRYRTDRKERGKALLYGLKALVGLVMSVSAVILLSAALAHSYYALIEAPWLRIEEIEITGLKRLDRKEILNVLGVPRGSSILNLKIADLSRKLETVPWLQSAVVRLDPPGRLAIEVIEREPIAIILADGLYLLDKEGRLFVQTSIEESPGLLLVTGFSEQGLHEKDFLPSGPMEALRELLTALEKSRSWLPIQLISECRWRNYEGFILYTAQKAVPIQLGSDEFEPKLGRLQRVLGTLVERQWIEMVTRIDLDYPNRAFVEGRFPTPRGI